MFVFRLVNNWPSRCRPGKYRLLIGRLILILFSHWPVTPTLWSSWGDRCREEVVHPSPLLKVATPLSRLLSTLAPLLLFNHSLVIVMISFITEAKSNIALETSSPPSLILENFVQLGKFCYTALGCSNKTILWKQLDFWYVYCEQAPLMWGITPIERYKGVLCGLGSLRGWGV